jgi:hypothetical protein
MVLGRKVNFQQLQSESVCRRALIRGFGLPILGTSVPWLSWLERSVHIRKVTGSSPVGTIETGCGFSPKARFSLDSLCFSEIAASDCGAARRTRNPAPV